MLLLLLLSESKVGGWVVVAGLAVVCTRNEGVGLEEEEGVGVSGWIGPERDEE